MLNINKNNNNNNNNNPNLPSNPSGRQDINANLIPPGADLAGQQGQFPSAISQNQQSNNNSNVNINPVGAGGLQKQRKIPLVSDIPNASSQIQMTRLVRSDFYSQLDRQADQDEFTSVLRKEGLFGLSKIHMEDIDDAIIMKKAQIEGRGEAEQKGLKDELLNRNKPKSEIDDLMGKDGLYIANESDWLINLETQLQKQRMMENPRFLSKLFKKNADLVVDQQFFDEKISKIRIVSLQANPALAVKRRPAINCERLNQNKHDPFRLRVYIGKITLSKHYRMITEELQIQELLGKVSQYKDRCDLALIPHYDRALKIIEQEIAYLERLVHQQPKKQIAILENERNKLQKSVADEANLLRNLIFEVLERWKQVQNIRNAQNKNHSPYKLFAKQYRNQDNGMELEFLLSKDTYTEDKEADRTENGRRAAIRADKIFVELVVNGQIVGQSGFGSIEWPSFEVKIMEQFHILIFTRPKSMQLRILQKGIFTKLLDVIDLEIPGDHSRTITATAQILSEVEFCQGASARRAQKLQEIEKEKKRILEKAKADELAREEQKKKEMLDNSLRKKNLQNQLKKDSESKKQDDVVSENNDKQELNVALSPEEAEEKRKEEERLMIAAKMEQLEVQEKKAREDALFRGKISILCEWTGTGDKMPPQNIDNFGKGQSTNQDLMQAFKDPDDEVHQIVDEHEDEGYHFDVNDPRNELQLEKLRNLRFKDQRKKVLRDIFLPFAHIDSLRERLIKCSLINPDITFIPMHEDEIYDNLKLMELIEKTEKGIFLMDELGEDVAQESKKTMFLADVAITTKDFFNNQSFATKKRVENIKRVLLKRQKFAMIRKQNNKGGAPLTFKNVVNEYIVEENEILLFELIKSCFTQQRKLQPKKKKEEKMRLQDIKEGISFLFHISHGTNVPVRDEDGIRNQQNYMMKARLSKIQMGLDMGMGMGMGYNGGMMEPQMAQQYNNKRFNDQNDPYNKLVDFRNMQELVRVNSYVQIKLIFEKQEYIISSKPFEGNNPEWSCDRPIFLPQLLNGKLSNYEIFNSANQIVVSLFDKKVIQKQSRTNKKKFNRTEHSFFLGNIQIPLFTLFQNQKLTATFRLNRPIIIIGYYTDLTNVLGINMNFFNSMGGNQKNQKTRVDPQTPTTISLSINVSPVIEIQQENDDIFYGDGIDNRIEYYALKWMETFKKNKVFSQRHIRVWGNDIEQNSFYLPRYLTMLRPPPIFSKGDFIDPKEIKKDIHAIEKVARFVSLIPFKNDTELFKDIPDIHCDSQQFLDLKGGDFEEHAFLLCNYFNYIDFQCGRNYKSYVILGHAIPEGKTFYVLRRDIASNKVEVWNPSTGEPFVMTSEILGTKFLCCTIGKNKQSVIHRYDKACPLYSIGCLVDNKNIYVNIQPSDAPSQIDWNIENPKLWSPFMNDAQIDTLFGEVGIESIYKTEDALKYEVTPLDPIKQLKMTIFSFLERRIVESRQKEVNFQPESTKFRSDGSKDELFQALESMKYKCRLSGLGTELSEENANPAANNSQLNQQAGMNQGNMGGFNQNNPMNMGGFPGNNPSMGGFGGNMPNSDQNEFQQNYNDAIKTLDLIQTKIEEYMPPNKKFFGFPLNMPFTTIEKVWDEIKQTSIHEILQTDIEYVLDVHCYPYPNFIVSVWVFIGVFYDL